MSLNFIIGWILQYYVLLALFSVGVHSFHVKCAPYKDLYDIVSLSCSNCLNWVKYLKNASDHGSYDNLSYILNMCTKCSEYNNCLIGQDSCNNCHCWTGVTFARLSIIIETILDLFHSKRITCSGQDDHMNHSNQ